MLMTKKLKKEQLRLAAEYFADDSYGEETTFMDYIQDHASKEMLEFIKLAEEEENEYLARGIILN